jgi:hypothetical protein
MSRLLPPLFAAVSLLLPPPLAAHHSFSAEFDAKKTIRFVGAVTRVEWTNPHVYLYIAVKENSQRPTTFAVESASPNVLRRARWGKDSVRVGDVVTVFGYRAKNGSDTVNAITLQLPDGTTLFAGSSADGERPPTRK